MLKKFFRGTADRLVRPAVLGLIALGVSPNALTLAGFLLTLAACAMIAAGRSLAGGLVLLFAAVFDMVDGAVAKVGGKSTPRGAFLDSTVDRLSDAALFLALFWQYLYLPGETAEAALVEGPLVWAVFAGGEATVGAFLSLAALVLGFLVSYIKARAEGLGLRCDVGIAERPERVVLPAIGLLSGQLNAALGLLVVLSAITAAQRFNHVWRQGPGLAEGGP